MLPFYMLPFLQGSIVVSAHPMVEKYLGYF